MVFADITTIQVKIKPHGIRVGLNPVTDVFMRGETERNWHKYSQGETTSEAEIPGGAVVTNPPENAGDAKNAGSAPGSGRPHGGGNGSPLQ